MCPGVTFQTLFCYIGYFDDVDHTDHSSFSLPFFLEGKTIYATTHKQTKQKYSSLPRQTTLCEFQNVNKQSRLSIPKPQNVNKQLRLSIPKPMLTGCLTPK